MKKPIFLFIALLSFVFANGQSYSLSGKVVDGLDQARLPGAHVSVKAQTFNWQKDEITDYNGLFKMEGLLPGQYQLKITFIGFQDYIKNLTVSEQHINLGSIALGEAAFELSEVVVIEDVVPVIQKGDTTEFRAEAFKTLPDADAESLVTKMPTVVVENGKIQVQGEDVQKVLVDGKPFFGNDPTAALRNLPAEVIDKIQIFDQQSDQAQFTGFDDGQTTKTINIITKTNMRNGQFGKITTGYGDDGKYTIGGNVNFFNGDQRISIIGLSNNVNQQNFTSEDLLGIMSSSGNRRQGGGGGMRPPGGGPGKGGGEMRPGGSGGGTNPNDFMVEQQGGITNTHAIGLNYSDQWGDKMDVSGSYFFNLSENNAETFLNREYLDVTEYSEWYNENDLSNSTNYNHRLNAKMEYTFDDANSIIMRPRVSWQKNSGLSTTSGQSLLDGMVFSTTDNQYESDLNGMNFSNSLLYRHKFDKPRRTISLNITTGYAPKNGESYLLSNNIYNTNATLSDSLDQFSTLDINSWNLSANLMYTEPIGQNSMLMMNYRSSWQQEESLKETFDFYAEDEDYSLLNTELTNIFSNDYQTQEFGAGLNYRKGDLMLMARASVQRAELINDQSFPQETQLSQQYLNVLPMAMVRYNISRTENLRLGYRSNTQLPSIEQLQNVVDNSNPLLLSIGNPELDQSYSHTFFSRYSNTNTDKGSVFFAMLSGTYTNDYIGNSTYLAESGLSDFDLDPGTQLTQSVNLDGYWNARSFLTYGFPVSWLSSNLNLNLTGNYTRQPGLINEELNYAQQGTLGFGAVLSSNISERVDFTLSSRSNFNQVNNSLSTSTGDYNYFNQRTQAKLDWIIGDGFVFRTDMTHQLYDGLSADLDQSYWLWNMSVGKKVFKNQLGEISLSVFDILNQNNSLTRTVTDVYVEDVQTNVLQRYFMLNFTYNLRNFKII